MKKVLIVTASSIPGGNTDRLSDAFAKGLQAAGHQVTKYLIGAGQLEGCRGCGACQVNHSHHCAVQDTMQELYPLFNESDLVVIASPLYFWTLSAKAKAFMDRLYAVSENDIYPYKEMYLLMTAGDDHENTFDIPVRYYEFITSALGWKSLGSLTAGGCKGEPGNHSISDEKLAMAFEAGKKVFG